jgi:hypothetical protein
MFYIFVSHLCFYKHPKLSFPLPIFCRKSKFIFEIILEQNRKQNKRKRNKQKKLEKKRERSPSHLSPPPLSRAHTPTRGDPLLCFFFVRQRDAGVHVQTVDDQTIQRCLPELSL